MLAQDVLMIKEIRQRELGLEKFSRRWVPIFCPPSKQLLVLKHQQRSYEFYMSWKRTILKESQPVTSPGSNIPIRAQNCVRIADRCYSKDAAGYRDEETMITIFVTGRKLILLDILPRNRKFNQLYLINYIFPDLKKEHVNFHRQIVHVTFSVPMDNSMWHNGSKVASKFEKHHVLRL
jgi:hypothetical protein